MHHASIFGSILDYFPRKNAEAVMKTIMKFLVYLNLIETGKLEGIPGITTIYFLRKKG